MEPIVHEPRPDQPEPIDSRRIWQDHAYRRAVAMERRQELIELLAARYALVSRSYIDLYLEHMVAEHHIENPLAERYLEADLGAPQKYLEFVQGLSDQGYPIAGRLCLDIGCSNGALLLACVEAGASDALGVDVSTGRLEAAACLCEGSPVRLQRLDIVEESIGEQFDVIFCIDVLEHVQDTETAIAEIARCLSHDPKSFAYVTVFNRNAMQNVLEEPHYSVPGLIRLGWKDAQAIWSRIQDDFGSRIEYGIYDWHDYDVYAEMAARHGLRLEPCYSEHTMLHSQGSAIWDHERRAVEFEAEFSRRLAEVPLAANDRALIEAEVADYVATFRRDHAAHLAADDPEATKSLFLKYYAQPIAVLLRHDDNSEPLLPPLPPPPPPTAIDRIRSWLVRRPRLFRIARALRSLVGRQRIPDNERSSLRDGF